ncbi:unnamed protein product [Polarella glacialis]|uniref:Uncharacterized protein n=1 Tax=Polarella glacialis TaxID=89957 RepID=A0A813KYG2_POLGL|nr:unnamed protein product [Polarella glacialis]
MPTSLFAGLCLLGSATRFSQQAPCERRLWAQMSKVRVVCKMPGAHLGRPRILMWPGRTCQHVGAEEARPKDNTNNDNNDLHAGLASMLVQRGRAPGYSRRQVQCNLPAQVQGGCPCAMDAALLGGAPSELPWQISAKVAGSGAKSCATSSCTSQVKRTQDLLQAALRTYIPAFMCRKRVQTSRRSLLQAARRTRCTADGPAPGFASGRLLPIPPQSSQQLVCLGRARDAALLCRMANLPACRLQTPISLKCCSNAVARVTTCCSTQALQIAAPLWAQQIPPVSQFRFAEPKVQKQVQKQAAAAAVGVVCRALPLVAVFGAATSSHDAALVPPLAAGSLMAVHGGRLPQEVGVLDSGGSIACVARAVLACMAVLLRRNFQLSSHCPLLGAWQGVLEWELSASDFVACSNNNNSNLAADRAVLAVLTSWLARGSFGRAELKKADAQAWWFAGAKKLVSAQAGGSKKILSGQLFSVPAGQLRPARQALPACDSLEATTTTATASLEPLARPDVCLSTLSIFKMSCNELLMKGALVGTLQKTAYCVRCAQKAQGHEWSSLQSVHSSVARQPPIQSQVTAFGAAWFNFSLQLANSKPYLLLQPSANWQARPFRLLLQSACQSSQSSRAARNMSTAVASRALRKSRQPRLTELEQPLVHTSEEQVDKSWPAFGGVCRSRNTQKCGTTLFLHCKTDCGVDAALLDGDVAKPPAAASRQYSPKRPCSSSLTPSAADPSSEAGFQVARLCRSATAVVLPHRGCTMLHTLHVPHTSKAKSTRAYTEAFPRSDVCLSTLSALKISCIELLRKSALAGMPRKTTDRVRCAQEAKRHEWYVLQSVRSSVARQPLFQSRINAFGSSNLAKCLADLSFQLASSKPCLLLQLSATGYARPLRLSWPSACQSPLASRAVQNTSTAGATAGALWKSRQRCSLGLEQTSVPQPAALGQKLAARAGFRPRRVALLHRDAAKQLAGSLTAGHRRRGVVAALSYARLASVHARYPRQHRQERVLTRQLLKFSRQPEALSTFAGLALRKFMSDTAHAGVERKTTDCVRCAQQAQGHEWCVLQSIHSSVARQPPLQSQVTAFGAAWSNFSLQLACQANWRARPFRLHLQSVCQSSQSSWAVRKMSTAVASRSLWKSRQPCLMRLEQTRAHALQKVEENLLVFVGVCRRCNKQKCGTKLFLRCKTDCGVDAALLDGDVAKPPAAASRQYSPKRPCSSSLTPSAADSCSEAGFQVARLCRSATAVVLPHRGCTMLHTLHVPHTSKAAHAVSPCNAVEIPTHLSVRKHTTMAWSASHFLSEVAALLQSSPSMKLAELKVPHSTKCQSLQPSASPLSRVSASRPCLLQGSFVKLKGSRPSGMQVRHESPCGINAATSRFASLWAESRTQKSLWTANSQCLSWQTTAPRCEDFFCLPPALAKSTTTTSVTMGPIARGQAVCHTSAPDLLRDAFGTNDSLFAVSARRLCGSRRACCRSHHPCQIPLTFPMALSFPNNCACEHAVIDEREFSFRMTPNECNSNNNSNTSNANTTTTTTSINTNSNNKIIMPGLDRLVSSLFMLGKQLAATFRASIIIRVATSPFRPRCCLRLLP